MPEVSFLMESEWPVMLRDTDGPSEWYWVTVQQIRICSLQRAGVGRESSCNVGAAWLTFWGLAVDALLLALRQLKATVFFSEQDAE